MDQIVSNEDIAGPSCCLISLRGLHLQRKQSHAKAVHSGRGCRPWPLNVRLRRNARAIDPTGQACPSRDTRPWRRVACRSWWRDTCRPSDSSRWRREA